MRPEVFVLYELSYTIPDYSGVLNKFKEITMKKKVVIIVLALVAACFLQHVEMSLSQREMILA